MPSKTRTKSKKINLALQGGGAHGAFTWGVLDKILEDGRLDIEGISGTSAGAINAVAIADGYSTGGVDGAREALDNFWTKLSDLGRFSPIQRTPWSKFSSDWSLDYSPGRMIFDSFIGTFSPYEYNPMNINPLLDLIKSEIDFDHVHACQNFELFICATNVRSGKSKIFANSEITADSVMASCCLPEIYQAVEIDGEAYWDGGYMGNPPLYPLFYETECEDVLLVEVNPIETPEIPRTVRGIHNRLNEITFNATLLRELRTVEFVSRLIDEGKLSHQNYMQVKMHAIQPALAMQELSSSSKLNLELEFLHYLRDLGRVEAENWIDENFEHIGKKSTLNLKEMFE